MAKPAGQADLLDVLRGRSPSAVLVRRLLPATLVIPVGVGLLRLAGEREGLYSATVGVALMVAVSAVGATGLLLWTALSLARVDRERREAEGAVRRSREQHRVLARNFPDGAVVLFDRDLRHLIADGSGLAAVGLSSATMEGRTIWEVFPAEVIAAIEPSYRAALAGDDSTLEYRHRGRTYLVRVVPVRDEETGEVWGGAVMVHDVSSRAREEAELREASERFASIFENAPIGEAIVAPDGRWLQVNRALCELVGHAEDELLEKTFQDITHPDDLETDLEFVRRMLAGEIRHYQMEKRYVHKRGHPVWIQLSVSLVHTAKEEPLYFIAQVEDISERRAAEQRLREAEERFRTLVEQLPLVTYIRPLDMSTANIYASPQVEQMLGYPAELWPSDPHLLEKIVHPDDLERVLDGAREVRATGRPFRGEYRYVRPDGGIVWVQDETYLVRDEGGRPTSVEGFLMDISERKRAEAERDRLQEDLLHSQKLEAIGQLAGGVAHEFNNMLMAITGHGGLLLGRLEAESPLRRDVEQIVSSAERAGALTRQLLAFGRKQVLQTREIDLNEAVEAGVGLLRPLIDPRIELVAALEPGLPAAVADPAQIEQVLVNLVLNARDAIAGDGTITITTAAAELDEPAARAHDVEPGGFLSLAVADSGSGMDEQTKARIFEPFFTTKDVGKGSGLGLSTAYGIVRQGGGFLTVASAPGRGTTMTISIPASAEPAVVPAPDPAESDRPAMRGRAVVVDDEAAVRHVCAELLEQSGFDVETAGNGAEALLLLGRPQPVELLLTDIVMPGIGGPELAGRAAALHPEAAIVYMSGYPGDAPAGAEGGRDAPFLQKPFISADLRAVLAALPGPAPGNGNGNGRLRCVVADDHPSVLDAICRVLDENGIQIVARAADACDVVDQVERHAPDVALLDVAMPGQGGVEAAARIRESSPNTRVLLYTGSGERELDAAALAAGARGVVLKSAPLAELVRAILTVAAGGVYVAGPSPELDPRLTVREQEVLRLLAEGNTNERVGRSLGISPDTVQTHVRNAMKKLGADTRTQAVATAMRRSLIR